MGYEHKNGIKDEQLTIGGCSCTHAYTVYLKWTVGKSMNINVVLVQNIQCEKES